MTKELFGIGFDMLFSELYKIMVSKATFLRFRRSIASIAPPGSVLVINQYQNKVA